MSGVRSCRALALRSLHEASRRADPYVTGRRGTTTRWRELRKLVMRRDGFACKDCGRRDVQLEVHHVDGDARNDQVGNLVTLCSDCHSGRHAVAS
jgi:5-methylcytosine-specific restriction endonuclease McrA